MQFVMMNVVLSQRCRTWNWNWMQGGAENHYWQKRKQVYTFIAIENLIAVRVRNRITGVENVNDDAGTTTLPLNGVLETN